MLDFKPVGSKETTMAQLTADLTANDLRTLTHEMTDTILTMIQNCNDAAVTFVPQDPNANDTYADDQADVDLAWTLGHVIVHLTASCEESAALAAELARGVPYEKHRSRSEEPWQNITTIAQCRHRLEESRRMCLASLDMWPDQPYLGNSYPGWDGTQLNAIIRFVYGLYHADSHLGQIADIIQQAKAAA